MVSFGQLNVRGWHVIEGRKVLAQLGLLLSALPVLEEHAQVSLLAQEEDERYVR